MLVNVVSCTRKRRCGENVLFSHAHMLIPKIGEMRGGVGERERQNLILCGTVVPFAHCLPVNGTTVPWLSAVQAFTLARGAPPPQTALGYRVPVADLRQIGEGQC